MECSGTVVLQPSFSFSTSGIDTYIDERDFAILKASRTKKPVGFLIIIESSDWNYTKTLMKLLSFLKKSTKIW